MLKQYTYLLILILLINCVCVYAQEENNLPNPEVIRLVNEGVKLHKNKEYLEALKYFEVFVVMRDSVRSVEYRKSTFKSQMKFLKEISLQRYLRSTGLLIMVLTGIILSMAWRLIFVICWCAKMK